jgi:hypothetical protein
MYLCKELLGHGHHLAGLGEFIGRQDVLGGGEISQKPATVVMYFSSTSIYTCISGNSWFMLSTENIGPTTTFCVFRLTANFLNNRQHFLVGAVFLQLSNGLYQI